MSRVAVAGSCEKCIAIGLVTGTPRADCSCARLYSNGMSEYRSDSALRMAFPASSPYRNGQCGNWWAECVNITGINAETWYQRTSNAGGDCGQQTTRIAKHVARSSQ